MTDQALVELAFTMLEKSYVPYSRFPVGAALEGTDGTVYTGCNVENAAYGSTLCAERTALVKAVSEGCRSFTRLAVVGNSADYCWPCGACRQMLYEFAPDLEVLVARQDHTYVKYTLRQLLPQGFGPDSLFASFCLCRLLLTGLPRLVVHVLVLLQKRQNAPEQGNTPNPRNGNGHNDHHCPYKIELDEKGQYHRPKAGYQNNPKG